MNFLSKGLTPCTKLQKISKNTTHIKKKSEGNTLPRKKLINDRREAI